MERVRVFLRHLSALGLVVLVLFLLSPVNAKAAAAPQYGGVMKIIDVAEGALPIGAPWEIEGATTNLMKPASREPHP